MKVSAENIRLLKETLKKEAPQLYRKTGVQDVRIGLKSSNGEILNQLCIQVWVEKKIAPAQLQPQDVIRIEGFPTDVIEVGKQAAHNMSMSDVYECPGWGTAWMRDKKFDKIQGGINIQKEGEDYQGTLGMLVYALADNLPVPYLLSCAHVIAEEATKDDYKEAYVCQGGKASALRIAEIHKSIYDKQTGIDCAIARLTTQERTLEDGIMDVENLERIFMEPRLGMKVFKSGARTGVTEGIIDSMEGNTFTFRYKAENGLGDKIIVCQGDSGSIVTGVTEDGKYRPVGMVTKALTYDGGGIYTHWGIALRFSSIVNALQIRLEPEQGWFHRWWNERLKQSYIAPLDKMLQENENPDFEYKGPVFQSVNPTLPGVVPLFCWYNQTTKAHFYTTDAKGEGKEKEGYFFIGSTGYYIGSQQENDQVPLFRYVNKATNDHKMILVEEIANAVAEGYEEDKYATGNAGARAGLMKAVKVKGESIQNRKRNAALGFIKKYNEERKFCESDAGKFYRLVEQYYGKGPKSFKLNGDLKLGDFFLIGEHVAKVVFVLSGKAQIINGKIIVINNYKRYKEDKYAIYNYRHTPEPQPPSIGGALSIEIRSKVRTPPLSFARLIQFEKVELYSSIITFNRNMTFDIEQYVNRISDLVTRYQPRGFDHMMESTIGFIPIIGVIPDIYAVIYGKSPFTGEEVNRFFAGAAALLTLLPSIKILAKLPKSEYIKQFNKVLKERWDSKVFKLTPELIKASDKMAEFSSFTKFEKFIGSKFYQIPKLWDEAIEEVLEWRINEVKKLFPDSPHIQNLTYENYVSRLRSRNSIGKINDVTEENFARGIYFDGGSLYTAVRNKFWYKVHKNEDIKKLFTDHGFEFKDDLNTPFVPEEVLQEVFFKERNGKNIPKNPRLEIDHITELQECAAGAAFISLSNLTFMMIGINQRKAGIFPGSAYYNEGCDSEKIKWVRYKK